MESQRLMIYFSKLVKDNLRAYKVLTRNLTSIFQTRPAKSTEKASSISTLLKTHQIAGKTKFNHQARRNLRAAREDIKAPTIKSRVRVKKKKVNTKTNNLSPQNNTNQQMKMMKLKKLLVKSRKLSLQQCLKLNRVVKMTYLLYHTINVERRPEQLGQMKMKTRLKVWKLNHRKRSSKTHMDHHISVEEEVEGQLIKRHKIPTHKMKVDQEEENLSRSRKLNRNSKYTNQHLKTIIKSKTLMRTIHNSSQLANLKIWIPIRMKCTTKKLIQTKDMKFI